MIQSINTCKSLKSPFHLRFAAIKVGRRRSRGDPSRGDAREEMRPEEMLHKQTVQRRRSGGDPWFCYRIGGRSVGGKEMRR
ncbi:hypothetical protein F2Q69_00034275 [Brassica cretica]|uniref:Uncharacterized protein n=2 Tax=Brassica TaxID=3705 RepID=A0A8S9SSW2_BRACR|nr:hypothetical protein F2Q69_00034275 [Brassica cretica]